MKKALLISSYCFEKATANGICANEIKDAFLSAGYGVDIVGVYDKRANSRPRYENEHAIEVSLPPQKRGRVAALLRLIKRCFIVEENKVREADMLKLLRELDEKNKYDLVVSFFFPLENLIVAEKLKEGRPELRHVIYELDSATDGVDVYSDTVYGRLAKRAKVRWAKKRYRKADMVCVAKCHEEHVRKVYPEFIADGTIKITDFPLMHDKTEKARETISSKIKFLYTGEISKSFRDPERLLRLFELSKGEENWEIDFFSKGDCEARLLEYCEKDSRVKSNGYVDVKTLDEKYNEAEFLLSIGNAVSSCMPSKVINYVSYGKPIIHISLQKKDVCADYLSKYPLAFIVGVDEDLDSSAERLRAFVLESTGKRVSFEEILKNYAENTPAYSVKKIEEVLKEE